MMGRKLRKTKQAARVGWVEVRNSLRWAFLCIWRVVCLARFLNPFRFLRHKQNTGSVYSCGDVVFQPSLLEQLTNAFQSEATIKRKLLEWAQDQIPTLPVTDFHASWSDGQAFCALLESVCPGSCPRYYMLKPSNKTNNCLLGLKLAHRYLSIPQTLITSEEMSEGTEVHESKVLNLIKHIKWAAAQRGDASDIDWSRTSRPLRAADGSILKALEPCVAKGGGLINGLVGKRCKFNIFVDKSESLHLEIEIKGPNGDICRELIRNEETGRVDSRSSQYQGKEVTEIIRNLSGRLGERIFGTSKTKKRILKGTSSDMDTVQRERRIAHDYKCLGENHILVTYIPHSVGKHTVSIKWHGQKIPGSPFTAVVAASVEKLVSVRSRGRPKPVKQMDFLDEAKKEPPAAVSGRAKMAATAATTVTFSFDDAREPVDVQDAILRHTSTVRRSLRPLSPLAETNTRPTARLTKQATVTRKRVLRRVVMRAGQEVEIHEAPGPGTPLESVNEQENMFTGQTESPLLTPSFDEFTNSKSKSRSVTPQPTTREHKEEHDMETTLNAEERRNPALQGKTSPAPHHSTSHRTVYRRYNSDSNIFHEGVDTSIQQPEPYSQIEAENHRGTPWSKGLSTNKSFLTALDYGDLGVWSGDSLSASHMREKLLEGGFITQMCNPRDKERIESDSTLDSDSDGVSLRGTEQTSESERSSKIRTSSSSEIDIRGMMNKIHISRKERQNRKLKSKIESHLGVTVGEGNTLNSSLGVNLTEAHSYKPDERYERNTDDIKRSMAKKPLGQTISDPSSIRRGRQLPPQRSNTSPGSPLRKFERQRSIIRTDSSEAESTTLKMLQSASFRKACFYVSQKAITESTGMLSSQTFNSEMTESDRNSTGHSEEKSHKMSDDADTRKDLGATEEDKSHSCTTGDQHKERREMIKSRSYQSLRLSLSLPTLSKNWKAFEIDPEDELQTIEETAAKAMTKRRSKRASIGAFDLQKQYPEYQTVGSPVNTKDIKRELWPTSEDPQLPEKSTPSPTVSVGDSVSATSNMASPRLSPSSEKVLPDGRQASLECQNGSDIESEFDGKSNISDKENKTPNSGTSNNTINSENGAQRRPFQTLTQEINLLNSTDNPKVNVKQDCQRLQLKIPKVQVDRVTQVTYEEIKTETGWVRPAVYLKRVRKSIKVVNPSHHQFCGNELPTKLDASDRTDEANNTQLLQQETEKLLPPVVEPKSRPVTLCSTGLSAVCQSSETKPTHSAAVPGHAPQSSPDKMGKRPMAQLLSEKTTPEQQRVSGGRSSPSDISLRLETVPRPRYIAGHKVVSRRSNRRHVPIDARFLRVSPNNSREEESFLGSPTKTGPKNTAGILRVLNLVQAVRSFSRTKSGSDAGFSRWKDSTSSSNDTDQLQRYLARRWSKVGCYRRRVMFSRRVFIHRRSSSRSSRNSTSLLNSQQASSMGTANYLEVDQRHVGLSTDDPETSLRSRKVKHKNYDVETWVLSQNNLSQDVSSDNEESPKCSNSDICNQEVSSQFQTLHQNNEETPDQMSSNRMDAYNSGVEVTSRESNLVDDTNRAKIALEETARLLPPPSATDASSSTLDLPERPSSALSQTGSTDDPAYRGFGVPPNVRQDLLEELNIFSTLTSPDGPSSRRISLADGGDERQVGQMNDHFALNGDLVAEEEPETDFDPTVKETKEQSDFEREQALKTIQNVLNTALSGRLSPSWPDIPSNSGILTEWTSENKSYNLTEHASMVQDVETGILHIPQSKACSAIGAGLTEGIVGAKNFFQVETAGAGNGTLTVGITGPRPHTVTETDVTYTGDDLYDVIYEVTIPGYYIISIRWSDISIPDSPFVCKVTY